MNLHRTSLLLLLSVCCTLLLPAQTRSSQPANDALLQHIRDFFANYTAVGYKPFNTMKADSLQTDEKRHELRIFANEAFCAQLFSPQQVQQIYNKLQRALPAPFNTYRLVICNARSLPIEELIPNLLREEPNDRERLWGKANYTGEPWVKNTSLPYNVTQGLQNRHLFVWASHGFYYAPAEERWKWQRPALFCTREDLFTQSFVYPYLFPMLEKAGAVVGTPRERDYQTQCIVIDNDDLHPQGQYAESCQDNTPWQSSEPATGFANPKELMYDSILPFKSGSWRSTKAVQRRSRLNTATWTPRLPQSGRYAVYVSYASRPNSIPDAHYTVHHKGGRTNIQVNQQMGGGTWVYIGTYEFEAGEHASARVVLNNSSNHRGIVTADAVRFGGGIGQHARHQAGTSGVPRYLEAARYQALWSGIPDTLANTTNGENDYADDLRTRGNMLNYLGGGSVYLPHTEGQRVPFELALALHSDAGFRPDRSVFGSLSISTTQDAEGNTFYKSGLSRKASSDFASLLLNDLTRDLNSQFGMNWIRREHWDRNYAETRMPEVPSAILEMLSHQNFTDMKYGHDPLFKFTLARSVYKTVLRFVNFEHGTRQCTVQPLPVRQFSAQLSTDGNHVILSWQPTPDSLESTANPTGYVLYTQCGDEGFDNGTPLGNVTQYILPIARGKVYGFKLTAVNAGGESFPSETLAAYSAPGKSKRVLIVNGFTRLSGPAWVETPDSLGFDLERDMGVAYGSTTAFAGRQLNFNAAQAGGEKELGLGHSSDELIGKEFAGNTFNYPLTHGRALASSGNYSFGSVSKSAFCHQALNTHGLDAIDYICGLQADRPYNLRPFKTFDHEVRRKLTDYLDEGGALLVSGCYIGSDNLHDKADRKFVNDMLKVEYCGEAGNDSTDYVNGLNTQFNIYRYANPVHYAAQRPDALQPASRQAFCALAYGNGQSAGVAYAGRKYRVFTMGFPFECICDSRVQHQAMTAIMHFLTTRN